MSTTQAKRRCKTCPTLIRMSKPPDVVKCDVCLVREVDDAVAKLREQMEAREAEERARQEALASRVKPDIKRYDNPALIAELHKMADALGRTPTADDCGGIWPARGTFERRFGTWTKAREAAGLPKPVTTRALILEALRAGPKGTAEIALALNREVELVSKIIMDLRRKGKVTATRTRRVGRRGAVPYVFSLTAKGDE